MSVALRHPRTGEVKVLQEGWCWACFFSGLLGLIGLPLFRRGLIVWGSIMVVYNVLDLIIGLVPTGRAATLYSWMFLVGIGLGIFLGTKANRMTIDRHLDHGWEYANRRRGRFSA